ncbi:MAG: 2-phosphosulfolactate phosphatase [Ignavibacteriales bacterium CG12_big_fil_rev_8_21_14_0_65_30_8]|nr:MAG: 2-phosphosulfolactate phosphatase [Ignavibacteriales bacterium CG12_big_fil_rev_8_21_14_0_65_30_8]
MNINVIINPCGLEDLYFTNKTVVVIDVLRATNTIINALENGAKEVIPVAAVEFAVKVSGGMFGGQTLLGGERNTKKIEGFALGNSPLEYSDDVVDGKTIVFYTTNGTPAIVKAKFSEFLTVCSFANVSAVAKDLIKRKNDFEILCASRNNSLSIEDLVCAGNLIEEISKNRKNIALTDSANASVTLFKAMGKDIKKMLSETDHGKLLINNGFEEDIAFCSQINSSKAVPVFLNNSLKLS